jgi:hypothetical protein
VVGAFPLLRRGSSPDLCALCEREPVAAILVTLCGVCLNRLAFLLDGATQVPR